jgi:RimJ/RimL family protein N-acetyltransferase
VIQSGGILPEDSLDLQFSSFPFWKRFRTMKTSLPVHDVPPFQADRVALRPLQLQNIHTHFRWNNDPELNRLDSEVPYEEESFGAFKTRFEQMCDTPSPSHRNFEIHARDDEQLIGVAFATNISAHNRHARIGVTIGDRDYWGRGYGRTSMELLLAFCFDALELHRVSAEVFEYHTAWRDLVEGMGFRREGVLREHLWRDGQYWDKEVYGLLKTTFQASALEVDPRPLAGMEE